MKRVTHIALLFLTPLMLKSELPDYPDAKRSNLVEKLHGVEVADPYRWLEDVDSEETREWIEAQNEISDAYFEETPGRDWIRTRLEKLWDYDKYSIPRKTAGRLFYTKKTGLQNQGVLYWREDKPDAEPRMLLDPNKLSEDGTVALSGWRVSDDGKLLAYGLSEAGSDWTEWKVREVDTGQDREDHLKWIKFSGAAWARNGGGFYYSRYPEPEEGERLESVNLNQKVYFHRLGDPQSEDRLVYERPDHPKWGFSPWVTEDGRFLTISIWESSDNSNAFIYKDLSQGPDAPFVELIPEIEDDYSLIGNDGLIFYFKTNHEAPNGRVIAVDTSKPGDLRSEVIPEKPEPLDDVSLLGDRFFTSYMVDVLMRVLIYDMGGNLDKEVELPDVGSVWGFGGRRDAEETFYYFGSYTDPGTIYRYELESGDTNVFAQPDVDFTPDEYVTEQLFFESKDGTRIPMFVVHHRDLKRNGQNPVYLYGYGGFNISLTPYFSPAVATWLEMGGVYAVANLRGGGEYGEEWHDAGTKEKKQNVFHDFQAAAEYLIDEGYTNTEKLAIGGGSNGGLLVGACINQRPDLYEAAIAQVGVFDMLRFHKFTIGWAWTEDFGSPDDPHEFRNLLEYSPYHNTQTEEPYPATLITTADHDDRVFPAHSFKFGAALQHAQSGDEPILMRIETKAGHGAGKPTSKQIEEIVDKWSFLARELGMEIK